MRPIESLELGESDLSIISLVIIAITALIHTSPYSLYVVLPVITIISGKMLYSEISKHYNKK